MAFPEDETFCRGCAEHVAVRDGEEHTGYCDHCAQAGLVRMARSLAIILEKAKSYRDLSDEGSCSKRWFSQIAKEAYTALGEPSAADIDFFK